MEFMCANGIDINEVLDKVFIGLQRKSNIPIAKRKTPFDGIEQYLWVKVDEERSFKVPASLETDTLWEAAKANTFAETQIVSLAKIMSQAFGFEVPEMEPAQYVLSNRSGFRGAACVLDRTTLKDFAVHLEVDGFFMFPSSIHEVILVPMEDYMSKSDFDNMVRKINSTTVDPDEQLGDCAYEIRF